MLPDKKEKYQPFSDYICFYFASLNATEIHYFNRQLALLLHLVYKAGRQAPQYLPLYRFAASRGPSVFFSL
jgi:hypothetical protein